MDLAYAVARTGGKQYKFEPGHYVDVELLGAESGQTLELCDVLAIRENGGKLVLGSPFIPGAKVVVRVLGSVAGEKLIFFRYKRRKRCRRRLGHRQKYSRIEVLEIVRG
ncbi:LSU ribosomal protein L21p [Candidatus Similichlamydia laticola]|uniref:Large ribosomal subunit protein bL21 n=2 Tax=Candidatus Similichlamydia laticola TaxID=2170265 RepID=A0A369KAU7_9BACT|nr:LSU ribosomal protein L21p [Candidatus Similichlamydia laticola]